MAIEPKTKGDLDKMTTGLIKLAQEDPSFHFRWVTGGAYEVWGRGQLLPVCWPLPLRCPSLAGRTTRNAMAAP